MQVVYEQSVVFGWALPLVVLGVVAVTCRGYGKLAMRLLQLPCINSLSYCLALGLLVHMLIGGVLNLTQSIGAMTYFIVAVIGFVANFVQKDTRQGTWRFDCLECLPLLLPFLLVVLHIVTLVPTVYANHHDDFFKYFPRILWMLQTGSVGGNPFAVTGFTDLGVQTYLQGALVLTTEIQSVSAFDVVFCFALACLLLNRLCRELGVNRFGRTLLVGLFAVFDPQYVNISALYSIMSLVLLIIFSSVLMIRESNPRQITGFVVVIYVALAMVAALKATMFAFVVPIFVVLTTWLCCARGGLGRKLAGVGVVVMLSVYSLWLLAGHHQLGLLYAHLSDVFDLLTFASSGEYQVEASENNLRNLLNWQAEWGARQGSGCLLIAYLLLFFLWMNVFRKALAASEFWIVALALSGIGITCTVGVLLAVRDLPWDGFFRYLNVVLAPLGIVCLALNFRLISRVVGVNTRRLSWLFPATVTIILIVLQLQLLKSRVEMLVRHGHMLSYDLSPSMASGLERVSSPQSQNQIRNQVQALLPRGKPILSLMPITFLMDYDRNLVYQFEDVNTLSREPIGASVLKQILKVRLRSQNIGYVIYQRDAVPPWGERAELDALDTALLSLSEEGTVLGSGSGIVVFGLAGDD